MKVLRNSTRSTVRVGAARGVMAIGAVGLVATLGLVAPSGAATVKPLSPVANVSLSSHATKTVVTHVPFKGTYTWTIALLWSSTGVQATSVSGTGTGTDGANAMTGSGAGSAANQCDPFSGIGALKGTSGLALKVVSSSATQACGVNDAAPTPVTVKGVATVTSGTGKFKGATGTLHFSGQFSIQSTTAGSSESDSFSATLTGTLTIKTIVKK